MNSKKYLKRYATLRDKRKALNRLMNLVYVAVEQGDHEVYAIDLADLYLLVDSLERQMSLTERQSDREQTLLRKFKELNEEIKKLEQENYELNQEINKLKEEKAELQKLADLPKLDIWA